MLPQATVVPCARSAEVFDRVESGSGAGRGHSHREFAGGFGGRALRSAAGARGLHPRRDAPAHPPQPDRTARSEVRRRKAGFLASRGARPVPQLLSLTPRRASRAVLRHRRQRPPRHQREAARCRRHRCQARGRRIRRAHSTLRHRRRPAELHPLPADHQARKRSASDARQELPSPLP